MTLTFEPMTLGSKVKAILENLVTKISHKLVEGSLPNLTLRVHELIRYSRSLD